MTRFATVFVWLGGGVFVGSLIVCVWWFVVVLGRPTPPAGPTAWIWNVLLFSVFAVHHSVFARESAKRWLAAAVPAELIRSVYVWTASLLLVVVCLLWRPIGGELFDVHGGGAVVLAMVQLAGIAVIARAVATIDPLELAGIRRSSAATSLQVGGLYRVVRHPLYLGWLMATLSAAHMTGDRLAFALITAAYLFAAVPLEERSLVRSFGDDYARYQREVRWRIVPFIY
jgi:protein-S-isoprenylcysteine O-methyltransferase Ste14